MSTKSYMNCVHANSLNLPADGDPSLNKYGTAHDPAINEEMKLWRSAVGGLPVNPLWPRYPSSIAATIASGASS